MIHIIKTLFYGSGLFDLTIINTADSADERKVTERKMMFTRAQNQGYNV